MREIKFRAWHKKEGKMYTISQLDFQDNMIDVTEQPTPIWINNVEIMQYIGFKDKNGVEIYEGDIARMVTGTDTIINGEITYVGCSFYISTCADDWDIDEFYSIEVLGNIYENPELLDE